MMWLDDFTLSLYKDENVSVSRRFKPLIQYFILHSVILIGSNLCVYCNPWSDRPYDDSGIKDVYTVSDFIYIRWQRGIYSSRDVEWQVRWAGPSILCTGCHNSNLVHVHYFKVFLRLVHQILALTQQIYATLFHSVQQGFLFICHKICICLKYADCKQMCPQVSFM